MGSYTDPSTGETTTSSGSDAQAKQAAQAFSAKQSAKSSSSPSSSSSSSSQSSSSSPSQSSQPSVNYSGGGSSSTPFQQAGGYGIPSQSNPVTIGNDVWISQYAKYAGGNSPIAPIVTPASGGSSGNITVEKISTPFTQAGGYGAPSQSNPIIIGDKKWISQYASFDLPVSDTATPLNGVPGVYVTGLYKSIEDVPVNKQGVQTEYMKANDWAHNIVVPLPFIDNLNLNLAKDVLGIKGAKSVSDVLEETFPVSKYPGVSGWSPANIPSFFASDIKVETPYTIGETKEVSRSSLPKTGGADYTAKFIGANGKPTDVMTFPVTTLPVADKTKMKQYENDVIQYNLDKGIYETKVDVFNTSGSTDKSQYNDLLAEGGALDTRFAALKNTEDYLNKLPPETYQTVDLSKVLVNPITYGESKVTRIGSTLDTVQNTIGQVLPDYNAKDTDNSYTQILGSGYNSIKNNSITSGIRVGSMAMTMVGFEYGTVKLLSGLDTASMSGNTIVSTVGKYGISPLALNLGGFTQKGMLATYVGGSALNVISQPTYKAKGEALADVSLSVLGLWAGSKLGVVEPYAPRSPSYGKYTEGKISSMSPISTLNEYVAVKGAQAEIYVRGKFTKGTYSSELGSPSEVNIPDTSYGSKLIGDIYPAYRSTKNVEPYNPNAKISLWDATDVPFEHAQELNVILSRTPHSLFGSVTMKDQGVPLELMPKGKLGLVPTSDVDLITTPKQFMKSLSEIRGAKITTKDIITEPSFMSKLYYKGEKARLYLTGKITKGEYGTELGSSKVEFIPDISRTIKIPEPKPTTETLITNVRLGGYEFAVDPHEIPLGYPRLQGETGKRSIDTSYDTTKEPLIYKLTGNVFAKNPTPSEITTIGKFGEKGFQQYETSPVGRMRYMDDVIKNALNPIDVGGRGPRVEKSLVHLDTSIEDAVQTVRLKNDKLTPAQTKKLTGIESSLSSAENVDIPYRQGEQIWTANVKELKVISQENLDYGLKPFGTKMETPKGYSAQMLEDINYMKPESTKASVESFLAKTKDTAGVSKSPKYLADYTQPTKLSTAESVAKFLKKTGGKVEEPSKLSKLDMRDTIDKGVNEPTIKINVRSPSKPTETIFSNYLSGGFAGMIGSSTGSSKKNIPSYSVKTISTKSIVSPTKSTPSNISTFKSSKVTPSNISPFKSSKVTPSNIIPISSKVTPITSPNTNPFKSIVTSPFTSPKASPFKSDITSPFKSQYTPSTQPSPPTPSPIISIIPLGGGYTGGGAGNTGGFFGKNRFTEKFNVGIGNIGQQLNINKNNIFKKKGRK